MVFSLRQLFTFDSAQDRQLRNAIYAITQLKPSNLTLYQQALRHSSVQNDVHSNERLEFLGDAVLSLIIGEYLFKKYPLKEEGFLTEIRARIENRESLGILAKKIGIDALLNYDKHATRRGGFKYIYGNALEALIGAVYLDQGYRRCNRFVIERLLKLHIDLEELIQNDTNYKSQLVTWASKNRQQLLFEIIDEKRIGHYKEFTAHVVIEGQVAGQGQGGSKKQAEQEAARIALEGQK